MTLTFTSSTGQKREGGEADLRADYGGWQLRAYSVEKLGSWSKESILSEHFFCRYIIFGTWFAGRPLARTAFQDFKGFFPQRSFSTE